MRTLKTSAQAATSIAKSRTIVVRRWTERLLLMAALLAASEAQADPGVIFGLGTMSCAKLNEQTTLGQGYKQNPTATAVFSWVQGYLSGFNTLGIQLGKFVDVTSIAADEQWTMLTTFCSQNPSGAVLDATQEILNALHPIEMCTAEGRTSSSACM